MLSQSYYQDPNKVVILLMKYELQQLIKGDDVNIVQIILLCCCKTWCGRYDKGSCTKKWGLKYPR